ncbi:TetR/AcrR family transcriptional regulator [Frondihabitans cladoniiphilus]|uniref:TetR/AcrR family transcriptional regulator n=1 Tax=Frondihabitans cladoniiphilus TaxID=715785 RepID=A0ABP8VI61_9MICO
MRTDALQNRERLIDVARQALEIEPPPTMAAVARAAGVGQGTLYRHFPTWDDLVLAVHRTDVGELVDMVPELLETHSPRDALRIWLGRLAEYGRIKKGLGSAIHSAMHEQLAGEGYAPVVGAIDALLDAGKADGLYRADVTGEELLLLVGFLWRLDLTEGRDERSARMLDVVLAGLVR